MSADSQKAIAVVAPLGLLKSKTIMVLTDSYIQAFSALHGQEIERRPAVKARPAAELATLDVFAAEPNHEDYIPGGETT